MRVIEMLNVIMAGPECEISSSRPDWFITKRLLSQADLISRILAFNTEVLSRQPDLIQHLRWAFLSGSEGLTAQKVQLASKACQTLFMWCESQLLYGDILRQRAPLLREIAALEAALATAEGAEAVADVEPRGAARVCEEAERGRFNLLYYYVLKLSFCYTHYMYYTHMVVGFYAV